MKNIKKYLTSIASKIMLRQTDRQTDREEILLFRTSSQYRMRGDWYYLVQSSGGIL